MEEALNQDLQADCVASPVRQFVAGGSRGAGTLRL